MYANVDEIWLVAIKRHRGMHGHKIEIFPHFTAVSLFLVIQSILVQIRSEIMSDSNACLDSSNPARDYSELEAKDAFERMVRKYGWNK